MSHKSELRFPLIYGQCWFIATDKIQGHHFWSKQETLATFYCQRITLHVYQTANYQTVFADLYVQRLLTHLREWVNEEFRGGGGGNYTGALGDFAPEMQKRALKNQKRAPENCHRLQCKSLFNVADLVNGMWWKVAAQNTNLIFGLTRMYRFELIWACPRRTH